VVRLSNVQVIVVITHHSAARHLHLAGVPDPVGGATCAPCEQDQTMAALLGVDVDRTISMTFVIGAAPPPPSPA